jgi:hypothetical protein
MDDLQPVSIVQASLWPLLTRNDLAVQFNRNVVGLHAELFDERAQSFGGTDLRFAINGEIHGFNCRIFEEEAEFPVETRLAASHRSVA